MRGRRVGTLVIVAGGVGLLVGRILLARFPGSETWGYAGDPGPWARDSGLRVSLVMNSLLLGLAGWHMVRFRLEKLIAIGLLAIGAPFTLTDPGAGPQAWERGYDGDELVGMWLFAVSAGVVLIGVVWSGISERPAGSKSLWSYLFGTGPGGSSVEPVRQGVVVDEGQRPRDGWWLAADGKWYPPEQRAGYVPPPPAPEPPPSPWWRQPSVVVFGVLGVLVVIGLVFFRDTGHEIEEPAAEFDESDADDGGAVQDEQWRIELDGDRPGVHIITMVTTFSSVDELDAPDEGGVGGRLVWPETEVAVCSADVVAVGDGFVQVGAFFPTAEECGPEMGRAFDDLGLPDTACLFVASNGVRDEYCAPLDVD